MPFRFIFVCFFSVILMGVSPLCMAAPTPTPKSCFDFTKKIAKPLKEPTAFVPGKDEKNSELGKPDWASISGIVEKPVLAIYKLLLDPATIRNKDNTTVKLKETPSSLFLTQLEQSIHVKLAFLFSIDWTETWAYQLNEGTKENPKSILISYEKISGTSHIQHLCGNILIKALNPKESGVFLYEELEADRQNAKDVLNGITGTLRTLRENVRENVPEKTP